MVEGLVSGETCEQGEHTAGDQVPGRAGGGIEKEDEAGEEEHRGAEISLGDEDEDTQRPGDEEGKQLAGLGQPDRSDLAVRLAQCVLVVGEIASHERHQAELGDLGRLELNRERADAGVEDDPEP